MFVMNMWQDKMDAQDEGMRYWVRAFERFLRSCLYCSWSLCTKIKKYLEGKTLQEFMSPVGQAKIRYVIHSLTRLTLCRLCNVSTKDNFRHEVTKTVCFNLFRNIQLLGSQIHQLQKQEVKPLNFLFKYNFLSMRFLKCWQSSKIYFGFSLSFRALMKQFGYILILLND
jgi:hypothetical protein